MVKPEKCCEKSGCYNLKETGSYYCKKHVGFVSEPEKKPVFVRELDVPSLSEMVVMKIKYQNDPTNQYKALKYQVLAEYSDGRNRETRIVKETKLTPEEVNFVKSAPKSKYNGSPVQAMDGEVLYVYFEKGQLYQGTGAQMSEKDNREPFHST